MKKQSKNPVIFILALATIITALTFSAYVVFFQKSEPVKVKQSNGQSNINRTSAVGSGPIKFTTALDNNYFYDNKNVYLYIDLEADKMESAKERTPYEYINCDR